MKNNCVYHSITFTLLVHLVSNSTTSSLWVQTSTSNSTFSNSYINHKVFLLRDPKQKITLRPSEVSGCRWIDVSYFKEPVVRPKGWSIQVVFKKVYIFPGFLLPDGEELPKKSNSEYHLWGLTFQLTCDCLVKLGIHEDGKWNASTLNPKGPIISAYWAIKSLDWGLFIPIFVVIVAILIYIAIAGIN